MKAIEDHAPNCNCDRCLPECGVWWEDAMEGDSEYGGPHCCTKTARHKGGHVCCCSDRRPKNEIP